MDEDIQTRMRPSVAAWHHDLPIGDVLTLWHRRDYYEDGSASDYYYIELTKEEFETLGGEFLED